MHAGMKPWKQCMLVWNLENNACWYETLQHFKDSWEYLSRLELFYSDRLPLPVTIHVYMKLTLSGTLVQLFLPLKKVYGKGSRSYINTCWGWEPVRVK